MTFAPYLCSTPKFISVLNQPSHFILTAAPYVDKLGQTTTTHLYCRPLKKCQRYQWKQSNASIAINRQHHFDNDTTIHNHSQPLFFCLPFKLFRTSRRHRPCYV